MAEQIAGWYPDPSGDVSKLRYWDGLKWTDQFTGAPSSTLPVQSAQPAQPVQPVQPAQPMQVARPAMQSPYQAPAGGQAWGTQPSMQAPYQAPPKQSAGLGVAALICGITGFCLLLPSIVAVVLGILGMRKQAGKGLAIAGLVLGIVGVLWWILFFIGGGFDAFMEGFWEGYYGALG